MSQQLKHSQFQARLLRPKTSNGNPQWAFVVLPLAASATLPRRGRTSIDGTINGQRFRATLEPDGNRSHWLKIEQALMDSAGVTFGDPARFTLIPVAKEPEPEVPLDLQEALQSSPEALHTWENTTTTARIDWIHWITSAKQAKTRAKRIKDAGNMLASGKKRVCCFDPSGFYSKAFRAPPTDN